jgi:hypothetical protein
MVPGPTCLIENALASLKGTTGKGTTGIYNAGITLSSPLDGIDH